MSGSRKLKFRNHPILKPYILEGFSKTHRTLGTGTFGVMEELTCGGTYYAGKKLHDFILDSQDKSSLEAITRFAQVCKLMSDVRHPNIIQFIGLHFDESPSYPMLVMEQLDTDLDSFLKNPASIIPFSLKLNIFYDIVKGLLCLHERRPPVIHRDLTARNILLNKSSMRAKIADYGNTLIFDPRKIVTLLRQIPDTVVYMPPEAMTIRPEYDTSLDIFSFGQIMLYTALQEFPDKLLSATYLDPETNQLKPRSEVERRETYFTKLLGKQHQVFLTLSQIIEQCLRDHPSKRPTARQLMTSIEDLKSEHEDTYSTYGEASKMELVQLLESIRMDTRRRGSSFVENEQMMELEEKTMEARITQLQNGTPGMVEVLRKVCKSKPMEWQQCLFRIKCRQLQYSELNSNKVLGKAGLKDIGDVKSVEMTSKLDDHLKSYFVIHFCKKNSPPWQLRVFSVEERDAWMEALKPGSTMTNDLIKYKKSILAALDQSDAHENVFAEYEKIPEDVSKLTQPSQDQTSFSQRVHGQTTKPGDQVSLGENWSNEGSEVWEDYIVMTPTNNDNDSLLSFEFGCPNIQPSTAQQQPQGYKDFIPPPLPAKGSTQYSSQISNLPRLQVHSLNPRGHLPTRASSVSARLASSAQNQTQSWIYDPTLIPADTHTLMRPVTSSLSPTSDNGSYMSYGNMNPQYKIRASNANRSVPVVAQHEQSFKSDQDSRPQPYSSTTASGNLAVGLPFSIDTETHAQVQPSSYENVGFHSKTQSSTRVKPVAARRSVKTDASNEQQPRIKLPVPAPRRRIPKIVPAQQQTSSSATGIDSQAAGKADIDPNDPYERFTPLVESLASLQKQTLFITPSSIEIQEKIGQGQYGLVHKGVLHRGTGNSVLVAIKSVKKPESEKDSSDFQMEMNRMLMMIHPNIVRVYGLLQQEPLPWVVMEYLPHGNLKNFLVANKRPVEVLVKYMLDVAVGMHYVSEKGLVHRDLAARNIIVGENEICKVSDFGLLREIPKDNNIYISSSTTHLPIRWMAPESLRDREFSTATDVWSYAVLLWEMYQPDRLPYAELTDSFQCCIKIIDGYRLKKPELYPRLVKEIMDGCWLQDPLKRPSFFTISSLLSNAFY